MGLMRINGKDLPAPQDAMTVAEIKELAGIPHNERLYKKGGQVLDDHEVVPTEGAELGAVTSWERG